MRWRCSVMSQCHRIDGVTTEAFQEQWFLWDFFFFTVLFVFCLFFAILSRYKIILSGGVLKGKL